MTKRCETTYMVEAGTRTPPLFVYRYDKLVDAVQKQRDLRMLGYTQNRIYKCVTKFIPIDGDEHETV